jgi:hypothetical protein
VVVSQWSQARALPSAQSLAEGTSVAQILGNFPTLDETAVLAVIAFAEASAEGSFPVPENPSLP